MSSAAAVAELCEWGVATRNHPGERVCGDAYVISPFDGGLLVAVIDGLGHGEEAALAARVAVAAIESRAGQRLSAIVEGCHAAMRRTRGAALALVSITGDTLTWIGVGNVEAVLFRAAFGVRREALVPRAGVVGYQLPPLREAQLAVGAGDLLVLASDGISSRYAEQSPRAVQAQEAAHEVLDRHWGGVDDALVLALRLKAPP